MAAGDLVIGGVSVAPGETRRMELPVARLPTQTMVSVPVVAVHGRRSGPRIWITAAVHGDEINGVEIVRRVLGRVDPKDLRGSLIAVPVVNVFGFISKSRYLPDRRDLNRSFPGSRRGSLASRIAELLMNQVVRQCGYGIDLHTAGERRTNLPQIRGELEDAEVRGLARAFGAPVVLHSRTRDGSLRAAATASGGKVLLFEGGETNRFNPEVIRVGVRGVLRVLARLGMRPSRAAAEGREVVECHSSTWIRARRSGLFRPEVELGAMVSARDRLGIITNVYGDVVDRVAASTDGMVIGAAVDPLVNRGDGLVHVGEVG